MVGAIVLPKNSFIEGVNDSKKLSEKKRELLYEKLISEAISWSVGIIDQDLIDKVNILNATKMALTRKFREIIHKTRFNIGRCIR